MIAAKPVELLPSGVPAAPNAAPQSSSVIVRLGYRPALDGVRGIAILAVLAVNSLLPFFRGGFIGVDIFFVLSGFLITSLLMEEWFSSGTISLKHFYARRALRLLPALFVLLIASCLYGFLFQSREMAMVTWREVLWVFFYFANWMLTMKHEVGSLDHAWSLSVEEQFYLLWPILLLALLRLRAKRDQMLVLLLLAIVGSFAWRAFLWHRGAHYLRLYYGTDTRADALLIGCVIGMLFSTGRFRSSDLRVYALLALFGGAFLFGVGMLVTHDSPFLYRGGFTLVALAAAGVIVEIVSSPTNFATRILSASPLVWIGRISYSLYLWHYPVLHALRVERFDGLGWSPVLLQVIRFGAVFGAACASFYLVEQPFLRFKKRLTTTV
jgi:peptidoglycan/LPS O-acetylase OafA/YrhL